MKRVEIQSLIGIRHDDFFRVNYILPAIEGGYIELKYPDKPNHPHQKYRLSDKGVKLKNKNR